jgi:hypothetical protein
MSKDKRGLGDVEYPRVIKTQTFKQFQFERLIKDGTVIPASKLAESKELELQRVKDFESASADEERHRRAAITAPEDNLNNLPLTRERFEDS